MARPKATQSEERRTSFFGANLTPSERAEIELRAARTGRRLSEYVRLKLLSAQAGPQPVPKLSNEAARKLAFELAKVGTNLNQLTFHANATNAMPDRVALNETLQAIVKATEALTLL